MWKLRHTLHGVRAWQFISHKCMRWLLAIPLSFLLFSSYLLAGQTIFAILFAAQLAFWGIAVIGLGLAGLGITLPGIIRALAYFFVSILGAFLGVIESLSGSRFAVWESPALSRGDESTSLQRAKG